MKQEQQRIAIAEACGITVRADLSGYCNDHQGCADWNVIPDYPNDLNAMHEAENKVIRPMNLWYPYCLRLPGRKFTDSIGATAAQRAEAFLRTLGLWETELTAHTETCPAVQLNEGPCTCKGGSYVRSERGPRQLGAYDG